MIMMRFIYICMYVCHWLTRLLLFYVDVYMYVCVYMYNVYVCMCIYVCLYMYVYVSMSLSERVVNNHFGGGMISYATEWHEEVPNL